VNGSANFGVIRERLFTAVVGDVLDSLGHVHQILPPGVVPVREEMMLVGRAMPVLVGLVSGPQRHPFGRLTEALDDLGPDEAYVSGGSRVECAGWGEILTQVARTRGAAGAVIDGYHRDTKGIVAQGWPVFSRGPYAQDSRVRSAVLDFRLPIEIGGVIISPGDLMIGDVDGVVVVPSEIEAETIELALAKVAAENTVLDDIRNGMTATEAFARHGVL